jgi:hypothetical protein
MSERAPRKRFNPNELKKNATPAIDDPLEFKANKCTKNARFIETKHQQVSANIWFDKHYVLRYQVGDESGKREGIAPDIIGSLITDSFSQLMLYGSSVKGFKFLNFAGQLDGNTRVILQKEIDGELLNVAIEAHYISLNIYEITICTAMISNSFKIAAGQFCIEVYEGGSILKKYDNGKLSNICNF